MLTPQRNAKGSVIMRFSALALIAALSACGPNVEDVSSPWTASDTVRLLEATVEDKDGAPPQFVDLYYARHRFPGTALAHKVAAQPVAGQSGRWRVDVPGGHTMLTADHLFYLWRATWPDGAVRSSASTAAPHEFVIGCTAADTAATLAQIATVAAGFSDNATGNPAYSVFSHFVPASLAGQGIPVGGVGSAPNLVAPLINAPGILQFAPRGQLAGESDEDYVAALSDATLDLPTTLAGLGYGIVQNDVRRRPTMGCIPSSEWFVHEAGFHLANGDMTAYSGAANETVRGETLVNGLLPPPGEPVPAGGTWHPRIWDLHVWVNDGAPVLRIDSPVPIAGLQLDEDRLFFYSETFE